MNYNKQANSNNNKKEKQYSEENLQNLHLQVNMLLNGNLPANTIEYEL